MPYNVTDVEVIVNEGLRIRGDVLVTLMAEVGDSFPARCFLCALPQPGKTVDTTVWSHRHVSPWFPDVEYPIEQPDWSGAGSGHLWDVLVEKVLPRTLGRADFVYCWEGGDAYTGIRVVDGHVTLHEVIHSLGAEVKR